MMNCKQGDLAFVCYPGDPFDGAIVQCVAWVGGEYDYWRIDRLLPNQGLPLIADRILRPLRDSDGEDEVLQMVGLPAGTRQAA